MSKSKQSTSKRGLLAVIGGVAIIVGIVMMPVAGRAYSDGANRIVLRGDVYRESDPQKALVYYQAADYVSGASSDLVIKQIKLLNQLGQFDEAARQINRLSHITPEIQTIRARIALERGVNIESNLATVLTAPDGATPLMAIKGNQTALAAELLARGLVRSSQRVIVAIPEANRSAQDNFILAKALYAQGQYAEAATALDASLARDITNLQVYKLQLETLKKLGRDTTRVQQTIEKLESGKI
jgi:Flp pilus assembly protein TadD